MSDDKIKMSAEFKTEVKDAIVRAAWAYPEVRELEEQLSDGAYGAVMALMDIGIAWMKANPRAVNTYVRAVDDARLALIREVAASTEPTPEPTATAAMLPNEPMATVMSARTQMAAGANQPRA